MNENAVIKIVCELNQSFADKMNKTLSELGILNFNVQSSRSVVFREKKRFFGLISQLVMEETPFNIYTFYIKSELEDVVMNEIAARLQLNVAGFGSIWSENVGLLGNDKIVTESLNETENREDSIVMAKNLIAMDVIVQRDCSEDIVKTVLELGYCVPCIFFGTGTGFRNTLGLLRITIPAEKEVLRVIVPKNDADEVMDKLIDSGHLDQPGKGFIFSYPVRKGIIDSKVFRGKILSAASIEQIIAAIDGLKGNVEWRKKELSFGNMVSNSKRKYLSNILGLSIFSDEGTYETLVTKAMEEGAAGATISKERFKGNSEQTKLLSQSRERSEFIIGCEKKDTIIDAVSKEDVYMKNQNGFIETKPVIKACTYLG